MTKRPEFTRTRAQTLRARELRRETSRTEARLWPHLSRAQTGAPFRRQYAIGLWFADYCCAPLKLVVEVDGPTHDPEQDAARDDALRQRGYDVLRFPVQEIDRNLQGVVDTIAQEVQLRLAARKATRGN